MRHCEDCQMKRTREDNKYQATIVFDLETTGFCPMPLMSPYHKVVQISAKFLEEDMFFDSFVNPEQEISPKSVSIHNISNEDVMNAEPIDKVVERMWKEFGLSEYEKVLMIAHNCDNFDKIIFLKECKSFIKRDQVEFWDTLPWLREHIGHVIRNTSTITSKKVPDVFKLEFLYKFFFNEPLENAHRSDADVRALSRIYLEFIKPFLNEVYEDEQRKSIAQEVVTNIRFLGEWRAKLLFDKLKVYTVSQLKTYFKIKCEEKSPLYLDNFLLKELGIKNVTQRMIVIKQILDVDIWDPEVKDKHVKKSFQIEDCCDNVDYYVKYKYKLRSKPNVTCRYERGLMAIKNKES